MSQDALQRIEAKLDSVIGLLASLVVDSSELEGTYEKIHKLGDLGLERKLIANILGTTQKTVRAALTPSQRKKTKRTSRKKKAAPKKKLR